MGTPATANSGCPALGPVQPTYATSIATIRAPASARVRDVLTGAGVDRVQKALASLCVTSAPDASRPVIRTVVPPPVTVLPTLTCTSVCGSSKTICRSRQWNSWSQIVVVLAMSACVPEAVPSAGTPITIWWSLVSPPTKVTPSYWLYTGVLGLKSSKFSSVREPGPACAIGAPRPDTSAKAWKTTATIGTMRHRADMRCFIASDLLSCGIVSSGRGAPSTPNRLHNVVAGSGCAGGSSHRAEGRGISKRLSGGYVAPNPNIVVMAFQSGDVACASLRRATAAFVCVTAR